MKINLDAIKMYFVDHFKNLSTETVGWLAILFLHCATIPPILTLLFGMSDRLPSIDVVIFLWTGLVLLFIKSLLNRDMLNLITISVGFMVQACLLGLLVFK